MASSCWMRCDRPLRTSQSLTSACRRASWTKVLQRSQRCGATIRRSGSFCSHYVEPSYAMRLLSEQPERSGYLLKERVFDIAVLVDALRRIDEGETVVDPTIVAALLGRRRRNDPVGLLTPREREVLSLVAEGLSNRATGEPLSATKRRVEAHIKQTLGKLEIPESPTSPRRVLAVLAFLRGPASSF